MKNIICCIKSVPADNEVRMDPETNTIIREGIESIINPFDSFAIEEAVRIKEKQGAVVTALSMGIPSVTELLKEAVALGADRGVLLSDRRFAGADTLATAYSLSSAIQKIGFCDLIICGKMATDGDTAQVGPMLAEMLDIPHITDVSKINSLDEDSIRCTKLTDEGYVEFESPLPALITVVKEINVPRLPSITGLLKGWDTDIDIYNAEMLDADPSRLGLSGSPTQVVSTFIPSHEVDIQILSGTIGEKAVKLRENLAQLNFVGSEE